MPLQTPGQFVEITDGAGTQVAVKQDGAVAASTDNALVVTLSPNSSGGGGSGGTVDQGAAGSQSWLVSVSNFPATQAVSGTVTANVGTGTQPVSGTVSTNPASVTAANVLVGTASTDNGIMITIPANRTWVGSVALSASLTVATGTSSSPNIVTTGSTASPAANTVVAQLALTSTVAANLADSVTIPLTVVAGTSAATLTLKFGGATSAAGTASGQLL